MSKARNSDLRTGFTTGACATAASAAACMALFSGLWEKQVTITLPKGKAANFVVHAHKKGEGWAAAAIQKDAGDDPDITHKAIIWARVCPAPLGSGISFFAGDGVGHITRPGLALAPGEPAINPVPRQMITEALQKIAATFQQPADFDVTISIEGGEALAKKTWNPRLGIEGGLSILGTTGIVRPFSCAAWIASIHRGIDVARAAGLSHVAGATGATSESAVQSLMKLPDHALLDMGDFAGAMLKYLRTHPIARITVAGGVGKITKLAQGHINLHSGRSQVNFTALAALAENPALRECNTAAEAVSIAGKSLAEKLAENAAKTAVNLLDGTQSQLDVCLFDRQGGLLARSEILSPKGPKQSSKKRS